MEGIALLLIFASPWCGPFSFTVLDRRQRVGRVTNLSERLNPFGPTDDIPKQISLWRGFKISGDGEIFASERRMTIRIAVVGAGGVGGGFGAALAKAGADVTFIARGAHLAAMKSQGLKIQGGRGETHLVPPRATDDPAGVGAVDIVLFCVKLWDVESAGARIKPLIGPDTGVIPLQNGIDAGDRLIPLLGATHVMAGTVAISATIASPGVIRQTGTFMSMAFGERDGTVSPRA